MLGYGALIVALQLVCLIHCLQQRRHRSWILLIIIAPFIGSVVYLYCEWLPQYRRRNTDNANPLRYRPAAPKREIERLQQEVRSEDSLHNRENLADEYVRQGLYAEAVRIYRECLSGPLENDPALLYKLAEAAYAQDDQTSAIDALNRIRALSDYKPGKVRLLLARCYEDAGQFDKAMATYEQALKMQADAEVKCRLALLLVKREQHARAQQLLSEVLAEAEALPEHLREQNRVWIDLARQHARAHPSPSSGG